MADLRIVLRGLARAPLFTLVAVLSLALGIGANTAIFSLLEQVMLRTLPVQDAHELVYLYSEGPWMGAVESDEQGGPSFSHPLFRGCFRHRVLLSRLHVLLTRAHTPNFSDGRSRQHRNQMYALVM